MEYYSKKSGVPITCHQPRHTMATQLLNNGADILVIQELLGHAKIELTMRYSKLSGLKAQKDDSPLIEEFNQRLLRIRKGPEWRQALIGYLGE